MPSKDLLETYPLYKSVEMVLPLQRHKWPTPAINARCPLCASLQTYNMISDYAQYDEKQPKPGPGGVYPAYPPGIKVVYQCASCARTRRYFLLFVVQQRPHATGGIVPPPTEGKATIQKVGQYPPWDIAPDPDLAKKLGPRVTFFKKGLICESQSFGLGAFAYFRRIVEELIDELLNDISALVPEDTATEYAAALTRARVSHRAVDKIEHVKDILPPALRPGGANPLAILHADLSEGLHALSDEDCLARAAEIRGALVFLVQQVKLAKAAADQFRKDIQAVVDRRTGKDDVTEASTTQLDE